MSIEERATDIEPYVTEFNTFRKLAAEHIIQRDRTVARAKGALSYEGFGLFCAEVGLDAKSSKCRKHQRIGAEADWLLPIADRLPSDWTTIYDLAVLGEIKVQELIRLGKLHPQTTAKELKAASDANVVGVSDETDSEAGETCAFSVDVSDLQDPEKLKVYLDLEAAIAPHGLSVAGLPKHLAEQLIEREAA